MNAALTWLLRGAAALVAAATQPSAAPAPGSEFAPSVDDVKAAYVQRLPGYVEWPAAAFADATAPVVVGVLGADAIALALARAADGRLVQGRAMIVKRLVRLDPADDVHLLFVGRGAWDVASRLLATRKGQPILVVADTPGALSHGAMVNFVTVDGRVRFELAPAAAEELGLKLSSRLLAVAERVLKAGP